MPPGEPHRLRITGLMVRCRPRGQRDPGLKPDSTEDLPCMLILCMLESRWYGAEVWRGDASGSNLKGPSQNSPRVASKQDVKITKKAFWNLEAVPYGIKINRLNDN
ncbi:hypothetical protein AVEN_166538-1 [Araneus ventricosus]|uniref:Uncharacterized protein n=1 Tax=Araneus ventricosus TaxID=182803 RepID=A0A4Y2U4M1_ARAVE|nr:hypothetical protein AVEN_211329-1 [Araneus ventricosus]GBO06928.1 hypothetical protein AVEN_166538-1 [Araneus ventricosus]